MSNDANVGVNWKKWWTVAAFATAMAWVESAVVFYLRTMIHRIEPHQPDPLPVVGALGEVELVREAATLAMHMAVGILAGRTWRNRFAYAALSFGIWDILYYVFLKVMCGWPRSLLDWDILFLLPLPWWGPVLAPVSIATLMAIWGTLGSNSEPVLIPQNSAWIWRAVCAAGACLALYAFMADALQVANQGVNVIRNVVPERFNWPVFCLGLVLMSLPVARSVIKPRAPGALPELVQTNLSNPV